jgi:hypothetical protein
MRDWRCAYFLLLMTVIIASVTTQPADLSFSRIPSSKKGLFLRGLVFHPSLRVRCIILPQVCVCWRDKDLQAAVSIFQLVSFATKLRLHLKSTSRAVGLGSRVVARHGQATNAWGPLMVRCFQSSIDRTITFPMVVVFTGPRMSVDSMLIDASISGWCDKSAKSFSLPPSRRLSQALRSKKAAVRLEIRFSM